MAPQPYNNSSIWSRSPYLCFQEAPRLPGGVEAPLLPFLIRREVLRELRRQPRLGSDVKLVGLQVTLSATAFKCLKEQYARLYRDAPPMLEEGPQAASLAGGPPGSASNIPGMGPTDDDYRDPDWDYDKDLLRRLERWLSEQLAAARTTRHLRGWKANFACTVTVKGEGSTATGCPTQAHSADWRRYLALLLGGSRKVEPPKVQLSAALDPATCMQYLLRPVSPCYLPAHQFAQPNVCVGKDNFKMPGCDLDRLMPLVAANHAEFSLIRTTDRNEAQVWVYHNGEHETWVLSGNHWLQCTAHMWRQVEQGNKILFGRLAAQAGAPERLEPAPGSLLLVLSREG